MLHMHLPVTQSFKTIHKNVLQNNFCNIAFIAYTLIVNSGMSQI